MNLLGLKKSIRNLVKVPSQVSAEFSDYVTRKLKEQWSKKADAYGQAWAPYAPASIARGRGPLMIETGAMKAGTEAKPMGGAGIQMSAGHPSVAVFHQSGTANMPARRVVPDNTMPALWREHLERLIKRAAKNAIEGR